MTVCFSNLDVQFFWVLVKPHCHVFGTDCNNSNAAPHERVQDVDSPFSVEPEIGVLPALATLSFTITFAPSSVNVPPLFPHLGVFRPLAKQTPQIKAPSYSEKQIIASERERQETKSHACFKQNLHIY